MQLSRICVFARRHWSVWLSAWSFWANRGARGRAAEVEAAQRVTVFREASASRTGLCAQAGACDLTVTHPQTDVGATFGSGVGLAAGYAVDIVSGATPKVFSVDAVSTATKFSDIRHQVHGGLSYSRPTAELGASVSYGWESDYRSTAVTVTTRSDVLDHQVTLGLAYTHNFDRVCDQNNDQAAGRPLERLALPSSQNCFKSRHRPPVRPDRHPQPEHRRARADHHLGGDPAPAGAGRRAGAGARWFSVEPLPAGGAGQLRPHAPGEPPRLATAIRPFRARRLRISAHPHLVASDGTTLPRHLGRGCRHRRAGRQSVPGQVPAVLRAGPGPRPTGRHLLSRRPRLPPPGSQQPVLDRRPRAVADGKHPCSAASWPTFASPKRAPPASSAIWNSPRSGKPSSTTWARPPPPTPTGSWPPSSSSPSPAAFRSSHSPGSWT